MDASDWLAKYNKIADNVDSEVLKLQVAKQYLEIHEEMKKLKFAIIYYKNKKTMREDILNNYIDISILIIRTMMKRQGYDWQLDTNLFSNKILYSKIYNDKEKKMREWVKWYLT